MSVQRENVDELASPYGLSGEILACLRAAPGGLTDGQVADRLGVLRGNVARRRHELVVRGLVADGGLKRVDSVGPARVWVASS